VKPLNLPLLLTKIGVAVGAVGLDAFGKLSPQGAALAVSLIVALGGTHIAQLLQAPPLPAGLVGSLGDAAAALVRSIERNTLRSLPSIPIVDKPPPATPVAVFLLFMLASSRALACTPAHTPQEDADVALYRVEQDGCVTEAGTREAIDACRAASRARFCTHYPSALNCDAGAP
jgi:hypothetical protein